MPSIDFGLSGVHVLVTGASGGIGVALVRTFLELGAAVTAQYNVSPRGLKDLFASGPASPLELTQADVTVEEDVRRLFDEAQDFGGGRPVQALVVNHGVFETQDRPVAEMSLEQWRRTTSINLDASFLLCREFLKRHDVGRDWAHDDPAVSITFIGSTAGKFGEAGHADYASSKAALMYGLLPSLKNEIVKIAPKGRVNSVNPGWVRTAMAEEVTKDRGRMAVALATTPLRKIATPEDVAMQVAVLVSPVLSGHVSGANVSVDGGMEGRCLYPP